MRVFRIARSVYPVLDGEGASRLGGRWNSPGVPIVYCAGSRALAILKVLVWSRLGNIPLDLGLFGIHVPDEASVETVALQTLAPEWRAPDYAGLRDVGDEWARSRRSLVLAVPSVIVPEEQNYLLNPLHPQARGVRVASSRPFTFDPRLLR
jgi:RES domain-containing protein